MTDTSLEVDPSELRRSCDPAVFDFKTTTAVEPLDSVIGQERAVRAVEFGLEMKSAGYNIFVTGLEGTGKTTIVKELVERYAGDQATPDSWCMVNNFKDEYRPKAIALPPSRAMEFSKRMVRLVEDLKDRLQKAFDDEKFQERQNDIQNRHGAMKRDLFQKMEQSARARNLMVNRTSSGYQTVPLAGDKPMAPDAYQSLPEEQKAKIDENVRELQKEIEASLRENARINQAMQADLTKLKEETALFVVRERIQILKEAFKTSRDVQRYLDEVQSDIIDFVDQFIESKQPPGTETDFFAQSQATPFFRRYAVNVLVSRNPEDGAPVVFETNPNYTNIFGQIEKRALFGTLTADFTMIQAGSLLQANGGYLIMEIEPILTNPHVWESLKRALQNKKLYIEDMAAGLGMVSSSLRPEPVPLDVKVILIGAYETFRMLQNHDPKFNKIFKVRADFDYEVKRTDETLRLYAQFISRVCREEKLLPYTNKAVASIVEYGEAYVSNQSKLSLRFGPIVGIIKEADYWARKRNATIVTDKHVETALDQHRFRYNLYEEKMQESYEDGTILIDVEGDAVGQVNALAVYQIGEYAYGRPSRITAETYMGKEGVVNIEREADLSGKTHDKGVLILSGYLGRTFARRHPLSLSISIAFEQSYGGVDGDSASSTELYAILSSLSGLPIHQGLAVTGSVNQKGEIQAIGGVNQKIEGFFDVCRAKGFTGGQGVLIPRANVQNLMLKKEIVEAVEAKRFHIYRVGSVEEGIRILTGVAAGKPDEKGLYPENTVFGSVQRRLQAYYENAVKWKKRLETFEA